MPRRLRIGFGPVSRIIAETGSLAITGQAAILRSGKSMPAASGSYTVAGQSAALRTATPSALPAWVTTNAPNAGDWYAIPGTALSSVEPNPVPAGTPAAKVSAWNSFSIDTRDSKVYTAANGGHADYSGNEVDALTLQTVAPAWVQRRAPTASAFVNENPHYADGRPDSRHSYYGQTVDEMGSRLMTWGGARWAVSGGMHTKVDSFRLSDNDWNPANTHPDVPQAISNVGIVYAFATCVDRATGDVYMLGNFNLYRWTRTTNTWTARLTGTAPYGNETACSYDSKRGRILYLGGQGNDSHYYTLATNTMSTASRTGAEAANVLGSSNAMVYVEAIDAYLLRKSGAGGLVYRIDAATFACTQFATIGGASIPAIPDGNGVYHKFLYAPNLQGCVLIPSYTGPVWFLRTHGLTAEQDWINRSTAAGVVKATDFRTTAEIDAGKYRNGVAEENKSTITTVYRDTTDGLTGGGCLRIDHPAAMADDPGAWMCTMNPAWTVKTQGMGTSRFYIQLRMKLPASRFGVASGTGAGWKILNIATYDPQNYYNGSLSNVAFEHVVQNVENRGHPGAYRRDQLANYEGFEIPFGGSGDLRLQSGLDNGVGFSDADRYCLWNSGNPTAGCWRWPVDEWFTLDIEIRIQSYNGTVGNEFRMWGTRAGSTTRIKLFENTNYSCGALSDGFTGGFNGVWLLPYETGRTSATFDTHHKYGQMIVSTQPIATPLV